MSLIFLSGPTTNTVRTVALLAAVRPSQLSPASAGSMSYSFATFSSGSPIIGNVTLWPCVSSMSAAHLLWLVTGSTLKPMILQLRFSNSGCSPAIYPSSVVQTGVKSLGCENKMAQPLPVHSWKLIVPCEVSAVKLGASSFIRNIVFLLEASFLGLIVPNGICNLEVWLAHLTLLQPSVQLKIASVSVFGKIKELRLRVLRIR